MYCYGKPYKESIDQANVTDDQFVQQEALDLRLKSHLFPRGQQSWPLHYEKYDHKKVYCDKTDLGA